MKFWTSVYSLSNEDKEKLDELPINLLTQYLSTKKQYL